MWCSTATAATLKSGHWSKILFYKLPTTVHLEFKSSIHRVDLVHAEFASSSLKLVLLGQGLQDDLQPRKRNQVVLKVQQSGFIGPLTHGSWGERGLLSEGQGHDRYAMTLGRDRDRYAMSSGDCQEQCAAHSFFFQKWEKIDSFFTPT